MISPPSEAQSGPEGRPRDQQSDRNGVIDIQNASKWYGDVIGVNQITLSIGPGITGLLGPNGAGKSTLMKLITGQLRPGRGRVRVLGMNPWSEPPVFRRMGFCPDSESFYENMTGLEFVLVMGRLAGLDAGEGHRRAGECLERVGMGKHTGRRIKGYSKGMRQRTKLATALLHDPEVLILDEPLNGLDPVGRIEMLQLFRDLGREGKTLLVSSHILHEIESLTEQVTLIHRGRVLAEGKIEEIRALIENQPLTLQLITREPRMVAQHVAGIDGIASIAFSMPDRLVIRSEKPEQLYEALQQGVVEKRYSVQELLALDDNLEAVFQYLVKE